MNKRIRWWPAAVLLTSATIALVIVRSLDSLDFQKRNIATVMVSGSSIVLLWLWLLLFSRAPWKWRLAVCTLAVTLVAAGAALFRIRGVSGDLLPIFEPRWRKAPVSAAHIPASSVPRAEVALSDFPQFLGPARNAVLAGPALSQNWGKRPPVIVWRQPIGAAWSGFTVAGDRAVTQEQRGDQEVTVCFNVLTGSRLWEHADQARYSTTIAGEGPRATPAVSGRRVFTLGATGILKCLELENGRCVWTRKLTEDAGVTVPEWGFASSPLVLGEKVVVSAGGADNRSLIAYRAQTGEIAWTGGSQPISYSSPFFTTLAGTPQILMLNSKKITAHNPETGGVLWEYPWGIGQPHVALPVPVGPDRVALSSGYGVGAELLEIARGAEDRLVARRIWKTIKLKAKFANFVHRDGFLYGLDDGMLACIDLHDGSQRWKAGRYGHGQILLSGDVLVVTAENGELVLLAPTPEAENELARFRVFSRKTWNPAALTGDLLLWRNDVEAACVRLPLGRQITRE